MNLLFTRSQMGASFVSLIPLRIGGTVTFKLHAELELSDEELRLVRKYSFAKATLITSDPAEDLARAFRPALFLSIMIAIGIVLFVPTAAFGRGFEALLFKSLTAPGLGFVSFVVLTLMYYSVLRKHVSVDQLRHGGRMFYCHSVVELDEHEAELRDICRRFYLTLEKAKNWGGREINPLPDGDPFYLENLDGDEQRVAIDRAMYQAGTVARKLMAPFTVDGRPSDPNMGSAPKDPTLPPQGGGGASAFSSRAPNAPRSSAGDPRNDLLNSARGNSGGSNTSTPPPARDSSRPAPRSPLAPQSSPAPQQPSSQQPASQQPPFQRPQPPGTPPIPRAPQPPGQTAAPGTAPQSRPDTGSSKPHPFAPKPPDDPTSGF